MFSHLIACQLQKANDILPPKGSGSKTFVIISSLLLWKLIKDFMTLHIIPTGRCPQMKCRRVKNMLYYISIAVCNVFDLHGLWILNLSN